MTLERFGDLSGVRGRLSANAQLAPFTWFRVGGPAELLFQPADADDLALFLQKLNPEIPVTVIGVGSNLLVRDGGIDGVTIRLSAKGFGQAAAEPGEPHPCGRGPSGQAPRCLRAGAEPCGLRVLPRHPGHHRWCAPHERRRQWW